MVTFQSPVGGIASTAATSVAAESLSTKDGSPPLQATQTKKGIHTIADTLEMHRKAVKQTREFQHFYHFA